MKTQSTDASNDAFRRSIDACFDVTLYDCFMGVAFAGIVVRSAMLIAYVITARIISYDLELTTWSYLIKLFWLGIDFGIYIIWYRHVRPGMIRAMDKPVDRRPTTLVEAFAWLAAGDILRRGAFHGRLSLFFTLNHVMVMGGIAMAVLALIYRVRRTVKLANKYIPLPTLVDEFIRQYRSSI